MSASFLLALIAVFAVSFGGRDQLLAGRLAERNGRGGPLLAAGALASALSALAMAAAGLALALVLPPAGADMLDAASLAVAALELAWPRAAKLPDEPTRSLFAVFAVLLARQFGDAARFMVFALAAGGSAWGAAAGGGLGGTAALAIGILAPAELARWPLRAVRLVLAGVLLIAAVTTALVVRGVIG